MRVNKPDKTPSHLNIALLSMAEGKGILHYIKRTIIYITAIYSLVVALLASIGGYTNLGYYGMITSQFNTPLGLGSMILELIFTMTICIIAFKVFKFRFILVSLGKI